MTPHYWEQATRELSGCDDILRGLIQRYECTGFCSHGNPFVTLARSIIGQQISVKAADSVWQKLMAAVPGFAPDILLAQEDEVLRNCGISWRKVVYLQDLAGHFLDGSLDVGLWEQAGDEMIVRQLIQVKGIGRWTAEMFLIFYMLRPDVLPVDDLGLQRALSMLYNANQPVSKLKMRAIAKPWQPWRSVATWYLWRSLDPLPVVY
jgi:DNA-3-methyladenine glycosylase II